MASDQGKQQAYCKVCSKHFSVSHGGIDDVRRHGEGKKHLELFNGFFKKNHGFSDRCPAFFFQKLNMSDYKAKPILAFLCDDLHISSNLLYLTTSHYRP